MMPQEKKFLHSLALAGAEYHAFEKLLAVFGSYERAWSAGEELLKSAGLTPELADAVVKSHDRIQPDAEMRKLVASGIAITTEDDPDFPKELTNIATKPRFLYIRGLINPILPRLAVVGTRKATTYGKEATGKIIRDLAEAADITIVSGLAQGIDAEAHKSALATGLKTIGVIGGGMDRTSFFPPENWNLAEDIIKKGGAIVSEYPPGAPALKHHFVGRNRIIAGLSLATLVVEAPEKSGALITASFALEQGRDVFAIPGQLFSPNAMGAHRLIQDGAKLITSADDILDELNIPRRKQSERASEILTGDAERRILELLSESQSVGDLMKSTNLTSAEIITCLSMLELKGFVRAMGQNKYQRIS